MISVDLEISVFFHLVDCLVVDDCCHVLDGWMDGWMERWRDGLVIVRRCDGGVVS